MPVKNIKKVPVFAWIPPDSDAEFKFEIVRSDGTIDNITDLIINGEILDGATYTIGSFNFMIDNSSESYTNIWNANDVLNFYCDYSDSATTKRFKGIIEKVSYGNNLVKISGRSECKKLLEMTVTKSYTSTETSAILTDLLSSYADDLTTTNVNESTTFLTVSWYQKPFWECVQELCGASGFDCYLDCNSDVHYFEANSVQNTSEVALHDSNIYEISEFAYDSSQVKNRVIVYGADIGNLPLIKTAEDVPVGDNAKELIINDSNITTETQAQERANYELSKYQNPPLVGEITVKGFATIQPGEQVRISSPDNNLNPAYYKIVSYRHVFDGFHDTVLTVEKEPTKIFHVMKDRIANEQKLSNLPNPNEMRNSWNFDFNTDSGTHSNTAITDGVLKPTSSSGTWISPVLSLSYNINYCELRVNGDQLAGVAYYVSTDNGVNFQAISPNSQLNLSPPGSNAKIKVVFSASTPQVDSLCLLYKE